MTTFGSDFRGVNDIDALWSFETDETKALQQAIARRLICPPGALFYAPTYGYDVRQLVADTGLDASAAERQINAEVRKDERVSTSSTQLTQLDNSQLLIQIQITPNNPKLTTFTLTLKVTDVTVQLLEGNT